MISKRSASHYPLTALAIAATVALAGCQPAHFVTSPTDPQGNQTPAATSTGTTPTGPAVGAPVEASIIAGAAVVHDQPFANAELGLVDLATGKPVKVLGGSATNLVNGKLQTDANGNFTLAVAALTPGQVVRVIATANGETMVTLIAGVPSGNAYQIEACDPPVNNSQQVAAEKLVGLQLQTALPKSKEKPWAQTYSTDDIEANLSVKNTKLESLQSISPAVSGAGVAQGTSLSSYRAQSICPNPTVTTNGSKVAVNLTFKMSAATTAVAAASNSMLALLETLKPSAKISGLNSIFTEAVGLSNGLEAKLRADGSQELHLLTTTDVNTGKSDATAVNQLLTSANVLGDVQKTFAAVADNVKTALSLPGNASGLTSAPDLSSLSAVGATLNGSVLTFSHDGGSNVTITLPTGAAIVAGATTDTTTNTTNVSTTVNATADLNVSADGAIQTAGTNAILTEAANSKLNAGAGPAADQAVYTSTLFSPGIGLHYLGGKFTVDVSQPAGQDDIGAIVARIKHVGVFPVPASGTAPIGTGTTDDPLSLAPAVPGGISNLSIQRPAVADAVRTETLPPTMGGLELGGSGGGVLKFDGYILNKSYSVARFEVFEDNTYTYLVTFFTGVGNNNLATAGHYTRLTTNSGIVNSLTSADSTSDIVAYSRNGNAYVVTKSIDYASTSLPAKPAL